MARRSTRARFEQSIRAICGAQTQPPPEFFAGGWEMLQRNDGRGAMARLIHYISERRAHRERWVGALQQATVPLKLIDGAADPVSGAHMAARYRELVPRPDVTLLEGVGHYPQVEAAAAVLEAYFQFRTRV